MTRHLSKLSFLLAAMLTDSAFAEEQSPEAAARAIIDGEARFYELGQEKGTRAAFLTFLADDGLVFQPGPTNGRKVWNARPEGGLSLKWQPVLAAMSHSCDLGYTTGPAEWRRQKEDEKPFGYGQFVSIWKRQKDGAWKVVLDVGSEVPGTQKIEGAPEILVAEDSASSPGDRAASLKKLRAAETWFADTAKTDSTAALIGSSSPGVRVHREGVFPAVGRTPARLMLSVHRGALSVERTGGDMSQAGDLAYSYGKYTLVRPENTERGHYLQIWRTEEKGEWKLTLDYQAPLPPEQKKPAG